MDENINNSSSTGSPEEPMKYGWPQLNEFPYHSDDSLNLSDDAPLDSDIIPKWISDKEVVKQYHFDKCVSVFDVAAYIVKKTGSLTTMKLQKLVYYCQAWSLVWDEEPLFNEKIEAWANGPVIRELFYFHRGHFKIDNVSIGNPDLLSESQKETIDAVLDFYNKKSSQELIDLTHSELPWVKAREGISDFERGNRVISLDSIAEYFSGL
jgi:uncharacterized phage-associated protein